jgi:phospholipid/cholesterol/gamma-HCH transport system substrate-binding protein
MDERVIQFRVGALVVVAVLILLILLLVLGNLMGNLRAVLPARFGGGAEKKIYIMFAQAPGVSVGTPVRKNGVFIGRVTDVQLRDEAGAEGVLVTAAIADKYTLRENEVCRIGGSLLGDAVLEFVLSGNKKLPATPLESGATILGVSSSDPMQLIGNLEVTLSESLKSVATTSDEIGKLVRHVSDLLESNDEQIARVANKAEDTLDQIRKVAKNADELLGDEEVKKNFKQALADFPNVLKDTRDAIGGFKSTLESADRNLKNVEGLTKPLGQRGEQLVDNIDRTTAKLDHILDELSQFSKALNDPNGSLGQLMNNPELYRHIESAVTNVDDLTRELRPIVRDARAFSDKISRHPELLGVRGALHPSSGIK